MTEFLQSIKSDLLSRRLLPFVALLAVALLAAVGYVVSGGQKSSASTPIASAPSGASPSRAGALAVTVAPANPNEAVSETPSGVRYQSQGPTRNPFIPLPASPAKNASTNSSSKSSASSSTSSPVSAVGSGGTSSKGSGSAGKEAVGKEAPPVRKKPAKPQFPYIVSIVFGRAATTPGQSATLTPYENLKISQLLPSAQDKRITFERVTSNGSGAVFKLVVPPILHGSGVCLPSSSECETIDLEAQHSEELEYIEADGQAVVYELKVVSITKKSASASTARARREAKAARAKRGAGALSK